VTLTRPDKAAKNTDEAMETAEVTKIHKYKAMREELRRRCPGNQVSQLNFIIGIQGTIVDHMEMQPRHTGH
jgi:hypothetical protein